MQLPGFRVRFTQSDSLRCVRPGERPRRRREVRRVPRGTSICGLGGRDQSGDSG